MLESLKLKNCFDEQFLVDTMAHNARSLKSVTFENERAGSEIVLENMNVLTNLTLLMDSKIAKVIFNAANRLHKLQLNCRVTFNANLPHLE